MTQGRLDPEESPGSEASVSPPAPVVFTVVLARGLVEDDPLLEVVVVVSGSAVASPYSIDNVVVDPVTVDPVTVSTPCGVVGV